MRAAVEDSEIFIGLRGAVSLECHGMGIGARRGGGDSFSDAVSRGQVRAIGVGVFAVTACDMIPGLRFARSYIEDLFLRFG